MLDGLAAVAPVADRAQPVTFDHGQDEALRAESGHDVIGGALGDVFRAQGVGERPSQTHQVVQGARPRGQGAERPGWFTPRWFGAVRRTGPGGRRDADADAGGVRVELEVQPVVRGAQGGETGGLAADDRRPVVIFEYRVVQPWQHLPRQRAQQVRHAAAEQVRGMGADERDPSCRIERAPAPQDCGVEIRGGQSGCVGERRGRGVRRRGGQDRPPVGGGLPQERAHLRAGGMDGAPLACAEPRQARSRPQQDQPAPHP